MVIIKEENLVSMIQHARNQFPEEACGLLVGKKENENYVIETVFFLENTEHSRIHFTISPSDQLKALKQARTMGLEILGNWHSHPDTPARMSNEDKTFAVDHRKLYAILSLREYEKPVFHVFLWDEAAEDFIKQEVKGE